MRSFRPLISPLSAQTPNDIELNMLSPKEHVDGLKL